MAIAAPSRQKMFIGGAWVDSTDGRTFDDPQILLFAVEAGRVRGVDQYIGDPDAVTAFWA